MQALRNVHLSPLGRKIVDTLISWGELSTHQLAFYLYGDIVLDNPDVRRSAMKVIAKTVTETNARLERTPFAIVKMGDHLSRTYAVQKVRT